MEELDLFRALPGGLVSKSEDGMTGAPTWSPGGTGLCRGMLWSSNMRRVAASRCQHRATLAPAAAGVGGKRSRENEALSLTPRWSRVSRDCSLEPPSGSLTWPWMSLGLERVGGRRGRTLSCGHAALPCGEGGCWDRSTGLTII